MLVFYFFFTKKDALWGAHIRLPCFCPHVLEYEANAGMVSYYFYAGQLKSHFKTPLFVLIIPVEAPLIVSPRLYSLETTNSVTLTFADSILAFCFTFFHTLLLNWKCYALLRISR